MERVHAPLAECRKLKPNFHERVRAKTGGVVIEIDCKTPFHLSKTRTLGGRGSKVLPQMSHCGADHVRGHNFALRTTFSKILDDS